MSTGRLAVIVEEGKMRTGYFMELFQYLLNTCDARCNHDGVKKNLRNQSRGWESNMVSIENEAEA